MEEVRSAEDIRRVVGAQLSDAEVAALQAQYQPLSRGVAAFPGADLKAVEPPLRSTPGPTA
jgi:hypothetical protein